MDNWQLEQDAEKLIEAVHDAYDHISSVSQLIETIDNIEAERDKYITECEELSEKVMNLENEVSELNDRIAELMDEQITLLETIQSLQE